MNSDWTQAVPIAADFESYTPGTTVPAGVLLALKGHETPRKSSDPDEIAPRPQKESPVAERIDLLESARGLLACWVMIGHAMMFLGFMQTLPQGTPLWLRPILMVVFTAAIPVHVFMILSGFVIFLLIDTKREPYRVYIVRRFLRLFPAFAICFIVGLLVNPLQAAIANLPWGNTRWVAFEANLAHLNREYLLPNIVAHATMLFGLIPRQILPDASGAFLPPAWSIGTEWQFYLLAPLLFAVSRRHAGFAMLALAVVILPKIIPLEAFENTAPSLILFQTHYFFIGAVSYAIWKFVRSARTARIGPSRGIAIAGLTVAFFLPDAALAIWVVLLASICQLAADPSGAESRVIKAVGHSGIATFLGRISYSIYLSHWPIIVILLAVTKPLYVLRWPQFATVFIALVCLTTVLVSVVLHRTVEMPAIRWGRRLFRNGTPEIAAATSAPPDAGSTAATETRAI